ncbi:chromosome segregation protein SMC [Barrientosiimonas marina]|uniref:Chromosome partition protein Smc n=1 Tax=Lentibacillus kimchii TaxID=1542911 RepID=A0ABW2UPC1_9BACI
MYLKRLESVGFKSFAERISVDFVPGMTSVVGPNGSGKSNITEAIRWVLGEQSARSLRGTTMEDVIFQGSDTRRALNVAEVTLVLDNSDKTLPLDYEEVSVTRRVYRSGESEFYLNKQSCRLKDIVDLFIDSGLGRESFSIISQGRVEEILSSKADERRAIFEEAAGVLKYKQRKKKAEYKLAETQENLYRVEDIIQEIDQQIGPLKEQAETARKYLDKQEQLKQQEISLLVTEIEQLHGEWQGLLDELKKEKDDELKQNTAIQTKEAELEQERQELQKLDETIEQYQADLLTATENLEQYEGKKQVFDERTKHLSENLDKLTAQKQEASEQVDKLEYEYKQENEKFASLKQTRDDTKQRVTQLESKLSIDRENISGQIEELKADYIENLNEQAAKRNEKQSIQEQLNQVDGKKKKQAETFADLLADREDFSAKLEKLRADYSEQEKTCQALSESLQQEKNQLAQKRQAFQEAQSKLNQGYQHIEKLKSKQEMLTDMKEDFQGFFNGVKAVLQAREDGKLSGVQGAMIELIDIPKTYITAIETVLGSQAQHVVVSDDQTARRSIEWLKETNSGRATFLPLNSIKERFVSREMLANAENQSGFIGVASDLVTVSSAFQKAVSHLMGHVLVARTLKDANELAGAVKRKHRVVTLEGDVVNPGGSMSGGAQKKSKQSLFTREKDLQDVTEKLQDYQQRTQEFQQQVDQQKQEISQLEEAITAKESQLNQEQENLQARHAAFKEAEMKLASLNDNLERYDQDNQQFEQDTNDLKARDEQLAQELAAISGKLEETQQKIDKLSEEESAYQENLEQLKDDYQKAQVTLAEQEERLKNQRNKTNDVQSQLNDAREQYERYKKDLDDLQTAEKSKETEDDIDAAISEAKAHKETITETIQTMRSDRSQRTQRLQEQDRELKEETKQHQAFKELIQEKDVKANRLDVELENRLSKLQNDYTMTFEKARQSYDKTDNIEETQNMVASIQQAIDQLGTVNLGAIDEYDRISERYDFLSGQQSDLVEAKQTLHTVIAEMDAEMEKRFSDTFGQIKTEFTTVFKQLFGGGKAELQLSDPQNLLDTGVEIIAQPPGKKLQHLGLLSGGERALTAIALLFAILRVRPVPFCVLDEVEAALDEANVVRFAKYLKTYSQDTQFIIITHRKGTMEQSDVLYGVTMQESGVSRLVSVRLEETEELINA